MSDDSTNEDSGLEMLNNDEMELLFKQEVNYWLQSNGHQLFEEAFAKCINVPHRKKVKAASSVKPTTNSNNLNTNK